MGPSLATQGQPIGHAVLDASLLAALQVYGRPKTEEQRAQGSTAQGAMGYEAVRTWRRGLGSVGVEWTADDDGTTTFLITPDRAQGLNLFPVPGQ